MFAFLFFLQILLRHYSACFLGMIDLGARFLGQALRYFLGNGPDQRTQDHGMEGVSRL